MDLNRIVNFLFEVGSLRKLPRAHRQTLHTEDVTDNISSHSYRVAIIGYLLAKSEKVDTAKVVMMCLLHDLPEARAGDQNWVHKRYVKVFEDEIVNDQLTDLVSDNELLQVAQEYMERKSPESLVAKDADLIDQILLLKEHALAGNKEAEDWLASEQQSTRVVTKTAKALVKQIYSAKVHGWWTNLWTAERR